MPKNVMSLRLDEDVVARIDKVRDGSRTRFIEEAILSTLAEREGTGVVAQGDKGTRETTSSPRATKLTAVAGGRLAHHPTCHCAVCKPPKQAA